MSSVLYSLNHKGVRLISRKDALVKGKKQEKIKNKKKRRAYAHCQHIPEGQDDRFCSYYTTTKIKFQSLKIQEKGKNRKKIKNKKNGAQARALVHILG